MQIYVHKNNQQIGPFTEAEIKAQLAAGTITPQDHAWWQGQANWVPLAQTPFATVSPLAAPAVPTPLSGMPVDIQTTSTGTQTSKLAIWSLVCACFTLFCGLLSSIPAIVLGHLALGDIKKTPGRSGRGLAIAGLIIGYIMTVLNVFVLVCYVMFLPQIMKMVKNQQAIEMSQMTNSADQTPQTAAPAPSDTTTATPSTPDQNTPTATPINTPDQSTNSPTATPITPDQSTNSADTNAAPPSTNAPDTSTNAAPMSQ